MSYLDNYKEIWISKSKNTRILLMSQREYDLAVKKIGGINGARAYKYCFNDILKELSDVDVTDLKHIKDEASGIEITDKNEITIYHIQKAKGLLYDIQEKLLSENINSSNSNQGLDLES